MDPTTGSVILRIVVPNPENTLLPGMFVRATLDEGMQQKAILVPQQAVSRDRKGNPSAMVVDKEEKVELRPIATDRAVGPNWLVSSGLSKGDRVIVTGLQKARPGVPVKIVPSEAGAPAPAKARARQATPHHRSDSKADGVSQCYQNSFWIALFSRGSSPSF